LVTLESRHLVARTIGWVASVSIANVATSRRSTAGRLELACIGSGIAPTKLASGGVVIASVKAGLHAAVADQGAGIDATSSGRAVIDGSAATAGCVAKAAARVTARVLIDGAKTSGNVRGRSASKVRRSKAIVDDVIGSRECLKVEAGLQRVKENHKDFNTLSARGVHSNSDSLSGEIQHVIAISDDDNSLSDEGTGG